MVGSTRDEMVIVGSEILSRHIVMIPSTTNKTLEIINVVAASAAEVGVTEQNLLSETVENSGIGSLVTLQPGDLTPGVSLGASIADGPSDSVCCANSGTRSILSNVIEESAEARRLGAESGSLTDVGRRHRSNREW